MAKIINGKEISTQLKDELKEKVAQLKEQGIGITLAVVQVGDNPASTVYVRNKKKAVNTLESGRYPMSFRRRPRSRNCLN